MSGTTNHVAEIAVPGQAQITIRCAHGQIELGQEYDGEWHGIYVNPEHVLRLIRAIFVKVGMEDVQLHRVTFDGPYGSAGEDIDWPDEAQTPREAEMMAARPDIDWKAAMDDLPADIAEGDKPKDRTAAERQRRRRAKQRDAKRDTVTSGVTERDALQLELVG